jgi:chromosome partitioning protein
MAVTGGENGKQGLTTVDTLNQLLMVIIIGNQKGGAGKSTLTLLLANYLTLDKRCKVTVLDMDYQQSISQKFEKAKILENTEP